VANNRFPGDLKQIEQAVKEIRGKEVSQIQDGSHVFYISRRDHKIEKKKKKITS